MRVLNKAGNAMKKQIDIKELGFYNKNFWIGFFCAAYLNAADEETDFTIYDILDEADVINKEVMDWWEKFTGYYEGVLDETDGYLDEPATLEIFIDKKENLKIEFHPGDIIYYMNKKKIGNLGAHFKLQTMPYKRIAQINVREYEKESYFLLLPIAKLEKDDIFSADDKIRKFLCHLFPSDICEDMARCIISQLI